MVEEVFDAGGPVIGKRIKFEGPAVDALDQRKEPDNAKPFVPPDPNKSRVKGVYIGAPACFKLELALRPIAEAFGAYRKEGSYAGIYLVGSALQRQDWRDVDVRFMMSDEMFAKEFPEAGLNGHWEFDAKWLLLTTMISDYLSKATGLPIDFQFQPQTHANKHHSGTRSALGVKVKE